MEDNDNNEGSNRTDIHGTVTGPVHTGSGNIIIEQLQKRPLLLYGLLLLAVAGCFIMTWMGTFLAIGGTGEELRNRFRLSPTETVTPTTQPAAPPTSTVEVTATNSPTQILTQTPVNTNTPTLTSTSLSTTTPVSTPTFDPASYEKSVLGDWQVIASEGSLISANLLGLEQELLISDWEFFEKGEGRFQVKAYANQELVTETPIVFEFDFIGEQCNRLRVKYSMNGEPRIDSYSITVSGNQLILFDRANSYEMTLSRPNS